MELDDTAAVITYEEYHPYGSTSFQCGNSSNISMKRYRFTDKERDDETGLYYHSARYYAPWLARWCASDPLQSEMPEWSSYNYSFNNPITFTDTNGLWPVYSTNGKYLGDDGNIEEGKDLAYTGTAIYDEKGKITGFENLSEFTDNHTEFQKSANIVRQESTSSDADEDLWIAHAANNAADDSNNTLFEKLNSGFSSVEDKSALSINSNTGDAKRARAAVIDVLSGGNDPTGGAVRWDGTDFLAWGLESPNGTPHNKFEEYEAIFIDVLLEIEYEEAQIENGAVQYVILVLNILYQQMYLIS